MTPALRWAAMRAVLNVTLIVRDSQGAIRCAVMGSQTGSQGSQLGSQIGSKGQSGVVRWAVRSSEMGSPGAVRWAVRSSEMGSQGQ